jgi:hypothetical protein
MQYRRLPTLSEGLVVAFDICSSSNVLEELAASGDLQRYTELIGSVKHYLADAQNTVLFEPYKFTGDGWILLFPNNTDGEHLFAFLRGLCEFFQDAFYQRVLRHLAYHPSVTGLTFGIDRGPLLSPTIFGQQEYVGRAIDVACRLQGAIKDADTDPAYKALVSNAAYLQYLSCAANHVRVSTVTRQLRNILGGVPLHLHKIEFLNPSSGLPAPSPAPPE